MATVLERPGAVHTPRWVKRVLLVGFGVGVLAVVVISLPDDTTAKRTDTINRPVPYQTSGAPFNMCFLQGLVVRPAPDCPLLK